MFILISLEIYKVLKKLRTYIGFAAIAILVFIVVFAMSYQGDRYLDFMTRNLQESFLISGNLLNGYFISFYILGALVIHIPFLVTLVNGDLLAGEATNGTYRVLVSKPLSRWQIVVSKFFVGQLYTLLLIIWLGFLSLTSGLIIFGKGELLVIDEIITVFAVNDIFWRFCLAYLLAFISMSVVASLTLFFSSLVENAIGPIISTMAVIIVFFIVSSIDIELFESIKPYLFTRYFMSWREIFSVVIDINQLLKALAILVSYTILFGFLTYLVFRKKDILS